MLSVALIGKSNVGKSTIFKRLTHSSTILIHKKQNTTRDRIFGTVKWNNFEFNLIDTGGIVLNKKHKDLFNEQILFQTNIAIEAADIIAYVIDNNNIDNDDYKIVKKIKKAKKKIILIINKNDAIKEKKYNFLKLGIKKFFFISAIHNTNTGILLDFITSLGVDYKKNKQITKRFKFSLIGQTNVGKSTITNLILGEKRSIVLQERNTTRDIISSNFLINKEKFALIDTPGIIKKKSAGIPYLTSLSSYKMIKNSDLVAFVIDCEVGINTIDKKIINFIIENNCPLLFIFNKMDLLKNKSHLKLKLQLPENHLYQKRIFVSAFEEEKTKTKIFSAILKIRSNLKLTISSSKLNQIIQQVQFINQPKRVRGRRLKIYYCHQMKTFSYPCIQLFVNDPLLISKTYKKFLYKKIYNLIEIKYVPLRIIYKKSY